jgi:beta-phosphoglucomutase
MKKRVLDAVIFDFDGVIVNSEPLHCEAFGHVLGPLGLSFTWDEYVSHYLGFDDRDAFREAFRLRGRKVDERELSRLIGAKAHAFQRLAREKGAAPFPGVMALIELLVENGIPLALCSGALRRDVDPILRRLGLDQVLRVTVTADDVAASKPDPASYRLVIERLVSCFPGRGIAAAGSVAIEDTPAGIEAARGAGLNILAVSNSHKAESLDAATRVVAGLEGLGLADLEALVKR